MNIPRDSFVEMNVSRDSFVEMNIPRDSFVEMNISRDIMWKYLIISLSTNLVFSRK